MPFLLKNEHYLAIFCGMCFALSTTTSAPLFLRKHVLGIPAQASGKNDVAINTYDGHL